MFTRPFLAYPGICTTMFVGSTAGGVLIVPSNGARVALTIQGLTDGVRYGPFGSINGSSFLAASQAIVNLAHSGAVYAEPNGAATAPIAIWESTS